ncbi:MBL fold metallo-hydrolase [Marixanthomonas spongiae]|uniref:MBL fold metallo-hydrolase n=1 Tax=Marixanthomonas spongiae TaxID=2174845 RepID=A0A2U0I869_9FLAO|nr:MBL fold metallo-hydrolase [Marixanthomonas spongiae]PVW17264.1 MBL fold metallo-hydrolase [Marixanthomonas spongiae]
MNIKNTILPLLLLCTGILFSQTDSGETVNLKVIKANDDVYMLQGKGGNIGLSFGKESILMIDDQYADLSEDILKAIRKISDKPIKMLVNTHFHGDHTGGNMAFNKEGAVIFSHENTRKRLATKVNSDQKQIDQSALPAVTFTDNLQFHHNNETIQAFHIESAHTDGDVALYFPKSNVIHTGDVFFNGAYPYIDTENGGSINGYLRGLQKIKMMINEDTKIIPGHGNIGTIDDLIFTINMLTDLHKQVKYHYAKGKSLQEVKAMKDITSRYDKKGYGEGFISSEKIITTIYNDLKKASGSVDNRSMEERLKDKYKEQQKEKKDN